MGKACRRNRNDFNISFVVMIVRFESGEVNIKVEERPTFRAGMAGDFVSEETQVKVCEAA
jgi:hypothetical protein